MKEFYLDASAILRLLTNDEPKATEVATLLNDRAVTLRIPLIVVAEVVYTLKSYYKIPKSKICEVTKGLISLPNVRAEKRLLFQVLELMEKTTLSFADAVLAVLSKKHKAPVFSYDILLNKHSYKYNGQENC